MPRVHHAGRQFGSGAAVCGARSKRGNTGLRCEARAPIVRKIVSRRERMPSKALSWTWPTWQAAAVLTTIAVFGARAEGLTAFQATLGETNQKTAEANTEEVSRVLADGSAIVLDARKRSEFLAGHIAG